MSYVLPHEQRADCGLGLCDENDEPPPQLSQTKCLGGYVESSRAIALVADRHFDKVRQSNKMVVSADDRQNSRRQIRKDNPHVAETERTVEDLKSALGEKGFDHRQVLAVLALHERGNASFPAAASEGKQGSSAGQQSTHMPTGESSRPGILGAEGDGNAIDEDAIDDDSGMMYDLHPSIKNEHRRVVRQTSQRGRSMLPRDASRFSNALYQPPTQALRAAAPVEADDDEPVIRPKKQMKSIRLDDSGQVVAFLASRLKRMQQLADKKIAKAWIKGICPKKQAKYPYSNNKREQEEGKKPVVPDWWPDVNTVCRFIEPDHIRREERMRLCIHLLRLRPTLEDFKSWNNDDTEPSHTHTTRGWTAFLQELAGLEVFDDLPKESPEKLKMRQGFMMQMYQLAADEEAYLKDERDGSDLFIYEEDEEDRKTTVTAKRSRRPSVASTAEVDDDRRSGSVSRTWAKRARQDHVSDTSTIADRKNSVHQNAEITDDLPIETGRRHSTSQNGPHRVDDAPSKGGTSYYHGEPEGVHTRHNSAHTVRCCPAEAGQPAPQRPTDAQIALYDHNTGQWVDANASSYCDQPFPGVDSQYMQTAPTAFLGGHNLRLPQYSQHSLNQFQVHHAGHISQPEFHTLPNTPNFSPPNLVTMTMSNFPTQPDRQLPQGQAYSTNMPSSQYFMPAHTDTSVVDFSSPVHMPPGHYQQEPGGLAQHHIAPMHSHGLPLTYPGAWQQQHEGR